MFQPRRHRPVSQTGSFSSQDIYLQIPITTLPIFPNPIFSIPSVHETPLFLIHIYRTIKGFPCNPLSLILASVENRHTDFDLPGHGRYGAGCVHRSFITDPIERIHDFLGRCLGLDAWGHVRRYSCGVMMCIFELCYAGKWGGYPGDGSRVR